MNSSPVHGIAWGPIIFLLLLIILIPGTILGWIAARRIRESEGKLYGLGLAATAGMLLPTILLILAPIISFVIIMRINIISSSHQEEDAMILGAVVFATIVLLCVKLIQGCLCRILGKGSFREPFGLKKNRFLLAALVLLWAGLGVIFFLQRPRQIDVATSAESPDQMYSVSASTWHRMRIIDSDQTTYRFVVQGVGGTFHETHELPVPVDKLAPNYLAMPLSDLTFSKHGSIHWDPSTSSVAFRIRDQEIHRFKLPLPEKSPTANTGVPPRAKSKARFGETKLVHLKRARSSGPVEALDLDTGAVIMVDAEALHRLQSLSGSGSTPSLHHDQGEKIEEWASRTGADLAIIRTRPKLRLATYALTNILTPPGFSFESNETRFDAVSAEDILRALHISENDPDRQRARQRASFEKIVAPGDDNSLTQLFRTDRGGLGVYEVRPSKADPDSVQIRFKLLSPM